MTCSRRRHGYVLVMTLLLLAIAAVTLAGVVAESQRRAMEAQFVAADLQRHWIGISCEKTLLKHAAELFAAARQTSHQPLNQLHYSLTVGGDQITLVLSDEQAKANINMLARYLGPTLMGETVRELAGPNAGVALLPTITREKGVDGQETSTQVFASYGQIFGAAQPRHLAGKMTEQLTCWGDSKLNTRAATPASVAAVAATVLDKAECERFAKIWQKSSSSWRDAFRDANILPDKVKVMESRVTDSSHCYALWVMPPDGRGCCLAISDGSEVSVFEW
ncbi:MAG: hypothetical protein JWM57_1099 [Phycisphaerales bacterium]|nr:hypothetical protein [Phycisphaerales bacterium]